MTVEPNRFELQIQSGLYAGAVETLPEGRYRIGSDIDGDIVLVEDGIAPNHVVIGVSGRFVRIEVLADTVTVDGEGEVAAGAFAEVLIPAGLTLGGIRIVLSLDAESIGDPATVSTPGAATLPTRHAVRALISLQVLAVLALMVLPNPVADALSRSDSRPSAAASTPAAESEPATHAMRLPEERAASVPPAVTGSVPSRIAIPLLAARRQATAGERDDAFPALVPRNRTDEPSGLRAAQALQAELERVGLLNVVVDAGPGIVTAAGTIEPSTASRWQSVQQWFDERFAGEITLVNGVSAKAEKLPLALGIEAVWRGEQSHLIIRGQKYLEGAVLEGGWTLHRIEPERVVLQRDGRLVAVRY